MFDDNRYISNRDYAAAKARLTRAVNSGDPIKVLDVCEKQYEAWRTKVWPDDWARWARALDDAYWAYSCMDYEQRGGDLLSGVLEQRFAEARQGWC